MTAGRRRHAQPAGTYLDPEGNKRMSHAMTANQVLDQLKKWHVPYKATVGWRTRNRAGHGAWGDMHGIVNHHTATPNTASKKQVRRLLKRGRSDLPGPLCNFDVARDGQVGLIGWGRANHAGAVRPQVLDAMLADNHPERPTTTAGETVDANAWAYGTEVHANGHGHYTNEQLLSLVLLNAAVADFHHWSATSSTQHYEITMRKVDMADIRGHKAGAWLRAEVKVALAAGPGNYTEVGWRPTHHATGYVAKDGDTWASIAKAHNTTALKLYKANHPVTPVTPGDHVKTEPH